MASTGSSSPRSSHAGWAHLVANTVPFVVMGGVICLSGAKRFVQVTVIVGLTSGVGVWLTGAGNSLVVGASGLVFGYLTYLVARGIFARNLLYLAAGAAVLAVYGGVIWGLLPTPGDQLAGPPVRGDRRRDRRLGAARQHRTRVRPRPGRPSSSGSTSTTLRPLTLTELHRAVDEREQRVVAADADVLPGWNLVPRWRTMIVPAWILLPPNTFTPRRWALESRPLRVEPPPLVFDTGVSPS